jgi:hypothetical protein
VALDCSAEEAAKALAEHVTAWGGEWTPNGGGGAIALPVAAGLRRGLVEGAVSIAPKGGGCRLSLEVTAAAYSLNWTAVIILAFGASAASVLLLWPFFPNLLPLAPIAALLAFSSWFLVAARLRTSSPQDYLDDLAASLSER